MEKKEIKQNYKRNTNKPIYQYKKISYYFNDSDGNEDEEEFSYTINDTKIQALKEQKIKNESKMSKNFKVENKMVSSKSQMNINFVENDMEKSASTSIMPKIPKKKKVVVKKKKKKQVNKNAPIHESLTEKKDLENDSEKNYYNTENLKNEENTPEKNPLLSSYTKDNENDISDPQINEDDNNILSNSQNLLNMPDFFGFELDEKDNNNNNSSKNNFIFDEKKENKKETKLKKNKSQKKIKTIKKKKKHIENKIKQVSIDEKKNNEDNMADEKKDQNIENTDNNNNNNDDINKYSLSNEDLKEFKIIDDVNIKENNEDESNNISTSNNDSNVDSKNNRLRYNPMKLQNDNQDILAIKIQSIWRAHQIQKKIKFIKIVKNIIDKLSIIIKNKTKDNYSYFFGKISDKKKNKNIKLKSQKHSKKLKSLDSLISGMDTQKLNELIEKEKKYDILLAKYEEVMKELEKLKKEIEIKKSVFNQNLNLIDNKNQNISINIFPNDTSKKNKNEINSQVYERYTKINEISNIKILSKSKQDSKNFIINRNISVQILNIKKNENILFDQKYFNLYKIFNNLNEKNKFNMRNYFDKYKSIAQSLNCVEKYKKFEKITRRRNLVINLVKSFSINKIESRNKSKTKKIIKLIPKKSIKKKLSNSNISNNNINTFSESKLVINKIISKFNIIQKNNNYNKDKYNNFVITKLINKFNINSKKKSDFVITKVLNEFKINNNSDKHKAKEKGKLIRSENSQLMKKKSKSLKKKDINYVPDKINNNTININNNDVSYEEQIIKYLKQNRMIIEKIKNEFNLNRRHFNNSELVINKIKNIYIGKIKKNENVISKYAFNNFMINRINRKSNLVITKIENNFKIVKRKKNNNFIITKVVKNYNILGENSEEDRPDIFLSNSDTFQLKINSNKIKTSQNLIINKVINDSFIDKIITKKNIENKFKDSKLVINKIINNFSIRRLKKADYIINKSLNNNFMLHNSHHNNKNFNFVITKVQNKFNIKRTMISQCNEDNKEQLVCKYNNSKDKLVINKVISKLNYQKIKKKENIITKIINENIIPCDNNLKIEKNENLLNLKQNGMNLNKSNIDKNLVITKIISKLFINNTKKPKREKKGRKFKLKFLFVSDNNQLFIKRNKKLNRDNINNNLFNENNNNTKEKELENSIKEINLGNNDEDSNRKDSDIKKKRIRKFKSKKLFISDNNQLKIKGIKNKK